MGPSGSGKSTLIKFTFSLIDTPTSGYIQMHEKRKYNFLDKP